MAKKNWIAVLEKCLPLISIVLWVKVFLDSVLSVPQNFQDLRNRVVGARLAHDRINPYTYFWKPGAGQWYFDTNGFRMPQFSNNTASPFTHWILYPMASIPQHKINILWFMLEWASIFICIFVGWRLAKSRLNKWLVCFGSAIFCCMSGVMQHFFQGQYYLFVAAALMLFVFSLHFEKKLYSVLLGGICIVFVILTRPTFGIFFIPFFLLKESRKTFGIAGGLLFAYVALVCLNKPQRQLWQSYFSMGKFYSGVYVSVSQQPVPDSISGFYKHLEGMDMEYARGNEIYLRVYKGQTERSNYFLVHKKLFGKLPRFRWLFFLQGTSIFISSIFAVWYALQRGTVFSWKYPLLLGTIALWAFDFFSAVDNHLYYITLIFPCFVFCLSQIKKIILLPIIFILIGITFNIFNVPIGLHATLGQIIILVGLVLWLWNDRKDGRNNVANNPGTKAQK